MPDDLPEGKEVAHSNPELRAGSAGMERVLGRYSGRFSL